MSPLRRNILLLAAAWWGLTAVLAGPALAADGDLDPTFRGDGITTVDFTGAFDHANDMAIQDDGRIVTAGRAYDGFGLARFHANGFLDRSFGGDGKVTTDMSDGFDWANAVAIQPDGRIVAAGSAGFNQFGVVRYRPNGTLDPTFGGGDGKVITSFTGGFDDEIAEAVLIQPDGGIVVGGFASTGRYRMALVRYHANGSIDRSFGGDGKVTTRVTDDGDAVMAMALQLDGKIVAVGWGFAVLRYHPDGTLDRTFGGDGKVVTRFDSSGVDVASGVVIQPDGRIVVVGEVDSPYFVISGPPAEDDRGGAFAVLRYLPGGRLDPSFAGDGIRLTDFTPDMDAARAVVLQADGRIVVAGTAGEQADERDVDSSLALARYTVGGNLDPSFGGDGKVTTNLTRSLDAVNGIAIDADGRIVAAGRAGGADSRFAVARYLA